MNCQDHLYRNEDPKQLARRWFLRECGVGMGALAMAHLAGSRADAADAPADPLAPRAPHFAPKAKRVIYLFMAGAPSQLELFDNKPQLVNSPNCCRTLDALWMTSPSSKPCTPTPSTTHPRNC